MSGPQTLAAVKSPLTAANRRRPCIHAFEQCCAAIGPPARMGQATRSDLAHPGRARCAGPLVRLSARTVLLDLACLDDFIIDEELAHGVTLVTLELKNLAHRFVFDDGAVAALLGTLARVCA